MQCVITHHHNMNMNCSTLQKERLLGDCKSMWKNAISQEVAAGSKAACCVDDTDLPERLLRQINNPSRFPPLSFAPFGGWIWLALELWKTSLSASGWALCKAFFSL